MDPGPAPVTMRCRLPTPMVRIEDGLLDRRGVELHVKLEAENHPQFGGNKLRKIVPNLEAARRAGCMIAFGIARSSLVYDVAGLCHELGLRSVGILHESKRSQAALARLRALDMQVIEVPPAVYQAAAPAGRVDLVPADIPAGHVLPEGGSNPASVLGYAEVVAEIDVDVDLITAPMGTGGTVAGLAVGAAGRARVLGFTALRGADYDADRVGRLAIAASGDDPGNWQVCTDYHSPYLVPEPRFRMFMRAFERAHGIELDARYNGKAMYGLWDLIDRGAIPRGTRIVAVHTGGLENGEHRLPPEEEIR